MCVVECVREGKLWSEREREREQPISLFHSHLAPLPLQTWKLVSASLMIMLIVWIAFAVVGVQLFKVRTQGGR